MTFRHYKLLMYPIEFNIFRYITFIMLNCLFYIVDKLLLVFSSFCINVYIFRAFHLFVNLLVQILLGVPLEMVHKWWRVLLIYFAGVLAGSLATSIADPSVKLAGASGGVYSLITAHIATIIMNWNEMSFPVIQLVLFLLVTASDVGTAIYNRYVLDSEDHIGYAAHFAGAIAGLLVGLNLLRNLNITPSERIVWWISIVTYFFLMAVAIIWNVAWPDYFQSCVPKRHV